MSCPRVWRNVMAEAASDDFGAIQINTATVRMLMKKRKPLGNIRVLYLRRWIKRRRLVLIKFFTRKSYVESAAGYIPRKRGDHLGVALPRLRGQGAMPILKKGSYLRTDVLCISQSISPTPA